MNILVAPQAFKGSLSAREVAEAIAAGVPAGHRAKLLPVADGGEGTVEALLSALGGERQMAVVEDPLGRLVEASWAMLPEGRAAIEMAAASGLPRLEVHERDPRRASTFGTGQLIAAALDAGASEVIVGIGGSATNDGGAFALQAMGARLLDSDGKELPRSVIHLQRLAHIDFSGLHERVGKARLRVMSDVTNPLLGPDGATAVYGPQKGMNAPMRPRLEAALARWADVVEREAGQLLRDVPGAGAAGGLGFALAAIGASLEPGAEMILDVVGFDERLACGVDLVITGEGRLDGQSVFGKATVAVARRAKRAGVPVLAIVGGLGDGYEAAYREGIDAVMPATAGPMSLEESQTRAAELISAATERAFRIMALGKHAPRPGRQ
ncbi:MAG TPA: glycerate kinase [Chloroflexota bacterium]|nr:glycerate kinase [Chloroflexota bacterium]